LLDTSPKRNDYDNAADNGPVEIASFHYGYPDYPPRWPGWTPRTLLAP